MSTKSNMSEELISETDSTEFEFPLEKNNDIENDDTLKDDLKSIDNEIESQKVSMEDPLIGNFTKGVIYFQYEKLIIQKPKIYDPK